MPGTEPAELPGEQCGRHRAARRCRAAEVEQIERRFGGLVALTGVDLRIQRGEIFGLVGPNGSGKTTLTNAITGFYPPQKGRIKLEGHDITGMAPHCGGAASAWRAPSRTWRYSTA